MEGGTIANVLVWVILVYEQVMGCPANFDRTGELYEARPGSYEISRLLICTDGLQAHGGRRFVGRGVP